MPQRSNKSWGLLLYGAKMFGWMIVERMEKEKKKRWKIGEKMGESGGWLGGEGEGKEYW